MSDKADKEIVNLATAASVGDDILIPCYVPGSTDPAQKVSGAQIKDAIVAEVLAALPVYSGGTGPVVDDLPVYSGETEDVT